MENQSKQVLGGFLNDQTERERLNDSMENASSQERLKLEISGRYRMKVDSFCFVKDRVFKQFPCFDKSSHKKALQLTVPLRVVDGTTEVPKGALFFYNITLAPAPGAKLETVQNMVRMAKPKLAALLGHDKIIMDINWLYENLVPEFEEVNDKWILKRNHKLTKEVMVTFEDGFYQNKKKLDVTTVVIAQEHDRSVSNTPVTSENLVEEAPAAEDVDFTTIADENDGDVIDAESVAEDAVAESTVEKAPNLDSETQEY